MAKVLNIKDYGYKVPDEAVYVGPAMPKYNLPASKWANPYVIGWHGNREEVIRRYKDYLFETEWTTGLLLMINELRGKDLVCWCHTWDGQGNNPQYCHADILLELANK